MTQELGRYCSYTPGRGESRDRLYEQIQSRWGSQLEQMPRIDKLQVLSLLAYTLVHTETTRGLDYDISCALDDLKNAFDWQPTAVEFLKLAAKLPSSEHLSLCEALVNQLKYGGKHK